MKIETKFSLGDYVISSQEASNSPIIGIVTRIKLNVEKDDITIKYDVLGNTREYTCTEETLALVTIPSRVVVL